MGVSGWIFHLCVSHLLNFEVCTWERGETQRLEQVWSTHVLVAQALGEAGSERCGLGQCRKSGLGEREMKKCKIQREQNVEEKGEMRGQLLTMQKGKRTNARKTKIWLPRKEIWNGICELLLEKESTPGRVIYRQPWLVALHLSPFFFSWTNSLFGYFSSCFASLWLPL